MQMIQISENAQHLQGLSKKLMKFCKVNKQTSNYDFPDVKIFF